MYGYNVVTPKYDPPKKTDYVPSVFNVVKRGTTAKVTIIKEVDPSLRPEIIYVDKQVRQVILPKGVRAWCHVCDKGFKNLEDMTRFCAQGLCRVDRYRTSKS